MNVFLRATVRRMQIASLFMIAAIVVNLFVIEPPVPPAAAANSDPQLSEQEQIDAYIQSRMQTANIPGLALGVVRDDRIVYLKGYGIAGPEGRAVTPQTPFIIGSLSKSFTALAVMQLVEAGQIDLDAPVTTYLPWFHTADPAASAQITVRNLLYQDSGLPVYEGRRGFWARRPRSRCDAGS
jgi:CubicO group peptidase (beta-lactamase class C family)